MNSLFQYFDALNWFISFIVQSSLLIGTIWIVDKTKLIKALDLRALLWRLTLLGCVVLSITAASPFGQTKSIDVSQAGLGFLSSLQTEQIVVLAGDGASFIGWTGSTMIIYLLIMALLLVHYVLSNWIAFKKIGHRRALPSDHGLHLLLQDLSKYTNVKPPRLTVSTNLSSPVCLSIKEICLPEWCLDGLDKSQQKSMLAHEMAHISHRDPAFFIFMDILEKVFFFQPLLRVAVSNMRQTAELLADQRAADMTGDAHSLAEVLLACAKYLTYKSQPDCGIAMAQNHSNLRIRMEKLMSEKTVKPTSLIMKAVVMLSLSSAAMAMPNVTVSQWHGEDNNTAEIITQGAPSIDSKKSVQLQDTSQTYLPIVRKYPEYPRKAAEQCLSGYVVVEFTVKADGSVADPRVVESESDIFNKSSLKAVLEFRYRPHMENGKPVDTHDVITKFTYEVKDTCEVKVKPE